MSIKVDISDALKQFKQLNEVPQTVLDKAYDYFVKKTPIRTGNARRHTDLKQTEIVADYPYAQRLDNGYSKQAPTGMTKPTEREIERLLNIEVRKIK